MPIGAAKRPEPPVARGSGSRVSLGPDSRDRLNLPAKTSLIENPPHVRMAQRLAQGRTAPAPGRYPGAGAAVRPRRAQPHRPALERRRDPAQGLRLQQPAGIPRPLLRRRRRAAHRAGLLRPDLGLPAEVQGAERRPRRAVLRPADPHRSRHSLRGGARRHPRRAAGRREAAGHPPWADPPSASTARKSGIRRASSSGSSTAPAAKASSPSPMPAKRGRPSTSGKPSTCSRSSASTTACAPSRTSG